MSKNDKEPKPRKQRNSLLIILIIVTLMGIFLALISSGVIPGKKADDRIMWIATGFCLLIGGGGVILSIIARIEEKIARKHFKEKKYNEDGYSDQIIEAFKNAIPSIRNINNIDTGDKQFKHFTFKQVKSSIVKYKLFDENNNVVYDSNRINKTFFVPLKISFNNHISNKSFNHIIGRILLGRAEQNMYFINTNFTFRVDNLPIDEYCKTLDIRMSIVGGNSCEIRYKNALIGKLFRTTTKRIDWIGKKVDPIEIYCIEDYLDIVFFLAFAIGYSDRKISTIDSRSYRRI